MRRFSHLSTTKLAPGSSRADDNKSVPTAGLPGWRLTGPDASWALLVCEAGSTAVLRSELTGLVEWCTFAECRSCHRRWKVPMLTTRQKNKKTPTKNMHNICLEVDVPLIFHDSLFNMFFFFGCRSLLVWVQTAGSAASCPSPHSFTYITRLRIVMRAMSNAVYVVITPINLFTFGSFLMDHVQPVLYKQPTQPGVQWVQVGLRKTKGTTRTKVSLIGNRRGWFLPGRQWNPQKCGSKVLAETCVETWRQRRY